MSPFLGAAGALAIPAITAAIVTAIMGPKVAKERARQATNVAQGVSQRIGEAQRALGEGLPQIPDLVAKAQADPDALQPAIDQLLSLSHQQQELGLSAGTLAQGWGIWPGAGHAVADPIAAQSAQAWQQIAPSLIQLLDLKTKAGNSLSLSESDALARAFRDLGNPLGRASLEETFGFRRPTPESLGIPREQAGPSFDARVIGQELARRLQPGTFADTLQRYLAGQLTPVGLPPTAFGPNV